MDYDYGRTQKGTVGLCASFAVGAGAGAAVTDDGDDDIHAKAHFEIINVCATLLTVGIM